MKRKLTIGYGKISDNYYLPRMCYSKKQHFAKFLYEYIFQFIWLNNVVSISFIDKNDNLGIKYWSGKIKNLRKCQ